MKNDLVILFGSGRSGTSWLHLMLGAHPEIVTGQQSRVFSRYLSPLYSRWKQELEEAREGAGRIHGISSFVSEADVIGQIRQFAEMVFSTLEGQKDTARITLVNQPGDPMSLPLIAKCFPKVKLIHSVRDGRDVALSLFLGYERFRVPDWVTAVSWWRDRTALGLQARTLGAGYIEVKYGDLHRDTPSELLRLFDFLGVHSTPEQAEAICKEYCFQNVRAGRHRSPFVNPGQIAASGTEERPEPKGFFRSGRTGQWRDRLSRRDLRVFNRMAGELLQELGFAWCDPSELPWFRRSIETVSGRWARRLLRAERSVETVGARVLYALERRRRG
jgi:hypothetical protein